MARYRFVTRTSTTWVLFLCSAVLIAWDILAATNGQREDTISEIVLNFARNHPVLPFIVGVVGGHLFWPQVEQRD